MREWLKTKRIEHDMTQADLARLINVDVTAIGKYELGERRPTPENAKKIAAVFNFDWTKFFDDEVNEPETA